MVRAVSWVWLFCSHAFNIIFYLKNLFFIVYFRERGREGEREGEKHWCERETSIGCLLYAPDWEPNLQPRHVPWLGIELATFLSARWHQSTEPHQLGHLLFLLKSYLYLKKKKLLTWEIRGWIRREEIFLGRISCRVHLSLYIFALKIFMLFKGRWILLHL